MTLPPEKIGDKGQRYVLQMAGWPRQDVQGWQNVMYSNDPIDLSKIVLPPSAEYVRVVDREKNKIDD